MSDNGVATAVNAFEVLSERGFVKQIVAPERSDSGEEKAGVAPEDLLRRYLSENTVTFYCGFDPTASSLHIGSLTPIMAMAHLQRAGHNAIAIIGGGTAMIGDPSGKTQMRQMLTREEITENGIGIRDQIGRYLDLGSNFLNNGDWLLDIGYIEFLRDIGRYFRVDEMLRAEAYKLRMEREGGLSFIEFNYQLLQAYDFLRLFRTHGCTFQIGGDDQWGNILAGVDLIRKVEQKVSYGMTFPLLTTAQGQKMGKTASGAIWLDAERTSPYEFYQYWINTHDADVARFLAYFTFLPMDEIRQLCSVEGAALRNAKQRLAYETTKLCHGEAEAEKAAATSRAAFGHPGDDLSGLPTTSMEGAQLVAGIGFLDLFVSVGLAKSKGEARRLVEQGGAYLNGTAVTDPTLTVTESDLADGAITLRSGKKKYHRVLFS